jgi:hypothetical protein
VSDLVFRIEPHPLFEGRAFLQVLCDKSSMGFCRFGLRREPAQGSTWQWDGNVEKPTITPSVNCLGGCGRHFSIINGAVA